MAKNTRPNSVPILGQDKPEKIFMGVVGYQGIHVQTVRCMFELLGAPTFIHWNLGTYQTCNVAQGRNTLAKSFLEGNADYLFFLDADMVFEVPQVLALVEAMKEHPDAGVMGGMYTKREQSHTPLIGLADEKGFPVPIDDSVDWLVSNRGKVVEADFIPTGFMLIRREAFEGLEDPFFYRDWPYRESDVPELKGQMMSSDAVFVRDVRQKTGMKTMAHLGVEVGHIGDTIYHPGTFYLHSNQFKVAGQLARIKEQALELHGANTRSYWDMLYGAELSAGRERDYPGLHAPILAAVKEGWKVLDMGSGTGVLADKLTSEKACNVTCLDISSVAVESCISKGLTAREFDLNKDVLEIADHGRYDCVIATEVLEHIEDPVKAVKKMYSFLKPGGILIVSTPNNCMPPEEEPEHLRTVTPVEMATWLKPLEKVEVLEVERYLLGLGIKPLKGGKK